MGGNQVSAYFHEDLSEIDEETKKDMGAKNTLKLISNQVADYQEDGEDAGFVILEATVEGSSARFKIPAIADSSGGVSFNFSEAVAVELVKKSVEVWE